MKSTYRSVVVLLLFLLIVTPTASAYTPSTSESACESTLSPAASTDNYDPSGRSGTYDPPDGSSPDTPIISTRGHVEEATGPTGSTTLADGHTKYGYDTTGDVPGLDTEECPEEIVIYVHGFQNAESDAIDNFNQADFALSVDQNYQGQVVGFSWDSNPGVAEFWGANDAAELNGRKLAQAIVDLKQHCPCTNVRVVTHSLGARVALEALDALEQMEQTHRRMVPDWKREKAAYYTVDSVHLMGAAVDHHEIWKPGRYGEYFGGNDPGVYGDEIEGQVCEFFNYYSPDDGILFETYPGDALGLYGADHEWGTPGPGLDKALPSNYHEENVEYDAQHGTSVTGHGQYNGYWDLVHPTLVPIFGESKWQLGAMDNVLDDIRSAEGCVDCSSLTDDGSDDPPTDDGETPPGSDDTIPPGSGDATDTSESEDMDGDGVPNEDDNCPTTPNPEQKDLDGDGTGDVCDTDVDGDYIFNEEDETPRTPEDYDGINDGDGKPENETDTDGDGLADPADACPKEPEDWDRIQDYDGCPEELGVEEDVQNTECTELWDKKNEVETEISRLVDEKLRTARRLDGCPTNCGYIEQQMDELNEKLNRLREKRETLKKKWEECRNETEGGTRTSAPPGVSFSATIDGTSTPIDAPALGGGERSTLEVPVGANITLAADVPGDENVIVPSYIFRTREQRDGTIDASDLEQLHPENPLATPDEFVVVWQPEGGNVSTGNTTIHSYENPGLYNVSVTYGFFIEDTKPPRTGARFHGFTSNFSIMVTPEQPEPHPGSIVGLAPTNETISVEETTTFDLMVTDTDDGVGSYELLVNTTDAEVARIVGAENRIGGTGRIEPAEDGSHVRVGAFAGDTDDTGNVTIATITVAGVGSGTAGLAVNVDSVSDEGGDQYELDPTTDLATITVRERPQAPEVVAGRPATDPDGDGVYEDVNGDNDVAPSDATVLFNAVFEGNEAVTANPERFDLNGDGATTAGDATVLFNEAFGSRPQAPWHRLSYKPMRAYLPTI